MKSKIVVLGALLVSAAWANTGSAGGVAHVPRVSRDCTGMELNDQCDSLRNQIATMNDAIKAAEIALGVASAACAGSPNPAAKAIACSAAAGLGLAVTSDKISLWYLKMEANRLGCPGIF